MLGLAAAQGAGHGVGVLGGEADHADLGAHPVLGHHLPGDPGRLLDVVGGAGGRIVEDDLLRDAPAHGVGQLVEQVVAVHRVAVLGGQHHRVAEGPPAREDRHLRHGIGVVQSRRRERVPRLVVGGQELVGVVHHPGAALGAGHDAVDGLVDVRLDDLPAAEARGQEGRLVEYVLQVGPRVSGGAAGDHLQVDALGDRLALGVDSEDGGPALEVGGVHGDLPVEAPGAQQRGVEHIGPVGRRDEDDVGAQVEAVEFDEQLVERLLALVVTASDAHAAAAAHGVDLVDEDDRGGVLLGLGEQVAYTRGPHADEHLDEFGGRDRVEGHAGLARDGTRQERLPRAGRPVEEDSSRDLRAQGVVPVGRRQEVGDLAEFGNGLVLAGHVVEGDVGPIGVELLLVADAPEGPDAGLHPGQEEHEGADDDDDRDNHRQDRRPDGRLGNPRVVAEPGLGLLDELGDLLPLGLNVLEFDAFADLVPLALGIHGPGRLAQPQAHLLGSLGHLDAFDRLALEQLDALGGLDRSELLASEEHPQRREGDGDDEDDDRERAHGTPLARASRTVARAVRLASIPLGLGALLGALSQPGEPLPQPGDPVVPEAGLTRRPALAGFALAGSVLAAGHRPGPARSAFAAGCRGSARFALAAGCRPAVVRGLGCAIAGGGPGLHAGGDAAAIWRVGAIRAVVLV